MITESFELAGATPGLQARLRVLRFGTPGAGPKAYIQAALHADETPALLVAQHLRERLLALEAAGRLRGEVVLVDDRLGVTMTEIIKDGGAAS